MPRRIVVDRSDFEYFRFLSCEPRFTYNERGEKTEEQQTDPQTGEPCWTLTVLAKQRGQQRPETISIKVAMRQVPAVDELAPVAIDRLYATCYTRQGASFFSFSTAKFAPIRNSKE